MPFLAALLLLSFAYPLGAQPTSSTIRWVPESPVEGTLFRVFVDAGSDALPIGGSFADQPLHFTPTGDGRHIAIAASPVDAPSTMRLVVELAETGAPAVPIEREVPISRGSYRLERLTVAPRFAQPPNETTAARIADEAARARAVSNRSHTTPRYWHDRLERPRPGRITSGFGHGREFNGEVQSRHMGTDFAGAIGAPVHAAAHGRVALVDEFYLGGKVIYIDHGAGLVTGYLHLSAHEVSEGQHVEAGQLIGRVGATGRVTGPHLHWIVRYGTITVDPMSLLALDGVAPIVPVEP